MRVIFNPTNTPVKTHYQDKEVTLGSREVKEFTAEVIDWLLENFNSLEDFDWDNVELVQDDSRRKYIAYKKRKYYIPDSETRNSLGYNEADFKPVDLSHINLLKDRPNVTSVTNAELIRLDIDRGPVYVVFNSPVREKRHIPNQVTRRKIKRRSDEVSTVKKEIFDKIPSGPEIRDQRFWDGRKDNTTPQTVHQYFGTHIISGGDIKDTIIQTGQKNETKKLGTENQKKRWLSMDFPLTYIVVFIFIAVITAYVYPNFSSIGSWIINKIYAPQSIGDHSSDNIQIQGDNNIVNNQPPFVLTYKKIEEKQETQKYFVTYEIKIKRPGGNFQTPQLLYNRNEMNCSFNEIGSEALESSGRQIFEINTTEAKCNSTKPIVDNGKLFEVKGI